MRAFARIAELRRAEPKTSIEAILDQRSSGSACYGRVAAARALLLR